MEYWVRTGENGVMVVVEEIELKIVMERLVPSCVDGDSPTSAISWPFAVCQRATETENHDSGHYSWR